MKRTLALLASALLLAAAAHAAVPANDSFANARTLTGKSGTIDLDISEATEEAGEGLGGAETTVWYRIAVPAGKTVVIDSFGSDFDTVLEAAPATSPADFFPRFQSDDARDTAQSRILIRSFQPSGSEIYHVRARGSASSTGMLRLSFVVFDGPVFEVNGPGIFAAREGGVAEVGVFRDGKAKVAATVQVVLEDMDATAGEDYLGIPVTLSFASGEVFKTARVPIYADGDTEGPENIRVLLVNTSANAIVGSSDSGEILIDDAQDDPANDLFADAETLTGSSGSINGDSTGAGTEPGEYPTNVGLDGFSLYARTVWYFWSPAASGLAELRVTGFATNAAGFAIGVGTGATPGTLTSARPQAQTYDPDTDEQRLLLNVTAGETYWIAITAPDGDGGPFTLKHQLLQAGALEVVPDQSFLEDSGVISVKVRRVGGTAGIVTVHFETTAVNGFDPEADPVTDYTGDSGTLTFGDGVTEQTFSIALTADSAAEGTENLPILLSAPTGGAVILAAERSIYIDEEEDAPANDLFASALPIAGASGSTGGDNTGAGIETGEAAGVRESVWYFWTVPTTGFAQITAGNDFSYKNVAVWRGDSIPALTAAASGLFTSGRFAVTAGETLRIAVATAADQGFIAEAFTLTWDISTGSRIHFSSASYSVGEDGGTATIRIARDGPTAKAATVRFFTTDYFFPGPGNATAGTDYKATSLKVTIPAGQSFKDILIPILRDNEAEGTEAIGLELDEPGAGHVLGGITFARLDVLDDADYAPQKARFSGLVSPTAGSALGESGYLTATTDARGMLTGKLLLLGKAYSFKGPILADGSAHLTIQRKGNPTPIVLNLQFGENFATLGGTIIVDSATLGVSAHRSTFTKANPAILSGRFTAVLEADANPDAPDAPGYAIIGVTPATGAVKIAGALADGTKFTWGTFLAPDGTIPVSVLLYKAKGILHGDLQLGDYTPGQDGSGLLHWIHPVQAKGQFSSAFESDLAVRISAYAFQKGTRALPLADPGDAIIDIADTAGDVLLSKNIRIDSKSLVTIVAPPANDEKVTIKIATATGLLSGSFKHTDGKVIPYTGVLYQRTVQGFGFFLGATVNGSVTVGQ